MNVSTVIYLAKSKWYDFESFATHIGKPTSAHCDICGWEGKYFASFYSSRMEVKVHTLCPNCGSVERTRELYKYLITKDGRGMCTLEVGALPKCRPLAKALHGASCLTIDIRNSADYVMDLTNLTFADETFGIIVAFSVLQQIEDDTKAIKEIYRTLTKGGEALLWIPMETKNNCQFGVEVGKWYRTYDESFAHRLEEVGFKVELIRYESHDASSKEGVIFKAVK